MRALRESTQAGETGMPGLARQMAPWGSHLDADWTFTLRSAIWLRSWSACFSSWSVSPSNCFTSGMESCSAQVLRHPVPGDLVVLDLLGRGDEARVADLGLGLGVDDLLAFLAKPLHGLAALAPGGMAQVVEYLLQPRDVPLGLLQMVLERLFQLGRARRLGHLGKGLHKLLFGVVQVADLVNSKS